MKGQVLRRVCAHFKVPGWSSHWSALLTKKSPMIRLCGKLVEVTKGLYQFRAHLDVFSSFIIMMKL